MADRFYGVYQSDERFYMNYNAQQQLPVLSTGLQHMRPAGDELVPYFTSIADVNGAAGATDVNNNCNMLPSLCYLGSNSTLFHNYSIKYGSATEELVPGNVPLVSRLTPTWSAGANVCHYNQNCCMPYSRACFTAMTAGAAAKSNPIVTSTTTATTTTCNFVQPLGTTQHSLALQSVPSMSGARSTVAYRPYPLYAPISEGHQSPPSTFGNMHLSSNIDMQTVAVTHEPPATMSQECLVRASAHADAICTATASSTAFKRAPNGTTPAGTGALPMADTAFSTLTPISNSSQPLAGTTDPTQPVTLQITNLDYSMDELSLRNFLLNQLKPITPVVSLIFEGGSYAKVTVPDLFCAKQVVSNLHRKKIGHKRLLVSYTRDSSLTEVNTLRCQVAGLLKDIPYYTLPMYKFRELFQSRFKTSISVLDLYKMPDICTIITDKNEEKFITLQSELANSLESSPLIEGLQHSIPYCTIHFKREQHKGWAEQDIEPLPNVFMTISEIQKIIYPLLKNHPGDIPVASLLHCISGQLNVQLAPDENGVNLEHLVCCVQGIQIQVNNFGIKILNWLEMDKDNSMTTNGSANSSGTAAGASNVSTSTTERVWWTKNSNNDPLHQISREIIELVKMSPKSTMKFNRFIPAYHNHFGKQCRVADYGYTKLIELFEALASVVQIMGDGENRQITLTHRTQLRRFTSDLLRVLRTHGNKSVLLSQLPTIFSQTQNRQFDVTDYGVCNLRDILDGLVNSNVVIMTTVQDGKDILISVPKRKQTNAELEKTIIFAGEMVELFRNAPQYTILFQKFVRSYHYHFAYQCRLSDYGFLKLADLMEAIQGVVEMEQSNDEDKKLFLSPKVARRVFAEQCEDLIRNVTGSANTCIKLDDVLQLHKKEFGYQIQPQSLGGKDMLEVVKLMPYVEVVEKENETWIICHNEDASFRVLCYRACKHLLAHQADQSASSTDATQKCMILTEFISEFNEKYNESINESIVRAMKHAIEIFTENDVNYVRNSSFTLFLTNIVRLLEFRTSAQLLDIKNALDCSIKKVSEFGYPNLFTLLTAYSDIFSIKLGISQERSEVSLQHGTLFRLGPLAQRHHLYTSIKLQPARYKYTRPTRPQIAEHSSRGANFQDSLTSARSAGNELNSSTAVPNTSMSSFKSKLSSHLHQKPAAKMPPNIRQYQQHNQNAELKLLTSLPGNSSIDAANIYSTTLHQTSFNSSLSNTSSNKENSFNSSLNIFNGSCNSSNTSLSESNSSATGDSVANMMPSQSPQSLAPAAKPASLSFYANDTSKLWDKCQPSMYHQQKSINSSVSRLPAPMVTPPAMVASTRQLLLAQKHTTQTETPSQTTPLQTENNSLYQLADHIKVYPTFEQPKPGTPPASNVPYWIDPIWAPNNDNDALESGLTIKLPEVTSTVMPMIYSPYTLSKTENMKQKIFNFINHDRKIA